MGVAGKIAVARLLTFDPKPNQLGPLKREKFCARKGY